MPLGKPCSFTWVTCVQELCCFCHGMVFVPTALPKEWCSVILPLPSVALTPNSLIEAAQSLGLHFCHPLIQNPHLSSASWSLNLLSCFRPWNCLSLTSTLSPTEDPSWSKEASHVGLFLVVFLCLWKTSEVQGMSNFRVHLTFRNSCKS